MPVSLEPIVRAEDSLKSLFTPFGVLRNRFLRHAGVLGQQDGDAGRTGDDETRYLTAYAEPAAGTAPGYSPTGSA